MAYKLKVKDKIYDLKDGFTIKEELNETLDSAIGIEFDTFHEEFVGVPFDHAKIYDDENKIEEKHFLVDSYDDEVYSFEENMERNNHHYVCKLFSETKGLERITLPCLTITQPTDPNATKKTVWDFMHNKIEPLFIPRFKRYSSSNDLHYYYTTKYVFANSAYSKFRYTICPEFQWNNPTLREVITDLMSTEDCIPVVKQGVISYYSLKEKGNPIDTTKLSYSKRTMNSGDFVGELTLNMKNAIGKSKTTCCEYIMLQAPEGSGTLTTENGVIKTLNPIYNIKKLLVYGFNYLAESEKCVLYNLDVVSRIKEYEDWNTLSNVKVGTSKYVNLPDKTDANGYTTKEHKVNYLYYERGKNEICNISKTYPSTGIYPATFVDLIGGTILYHITGSFPYKGDSRTLFFYVEYETILEHPINVGKYLPSPHPENRVFDAQKDSYVDVQHQSIFEYAKVERLGNKIREIYGEYFSESDIPQLGDYIGDEILFSKEVTYFDGVLLFKGYLTPHYVLRDYYTGVMAKKRSWEIAKGSEALTRNDIFKVYLEASFTNKRDSFGSSIWEGSLRSFRSIDPESVNGNVIRFFISALMNYSTNENLRHAYIRTETVNQDFPVDDSTWGIMLDLVTEVQGNSICFNFGFNDNFKSADYIEKDDNDYTQNFYKYCLDNDGYFQRAEIMLLRKTYGIGNGSSPLPVGPIEPSEADAIIENNFKRPRFGRNAALYRNDGLRILTFNEKDNREITRWTIQVEYCSDTADIIIGRKFIEKSNIVNPESNTVVGNLRLALSKSKYRIGENKIHSDSVTFNFTTEPEPTIPPTQPPANSLFLTTETIGGEEAINYVAKAWWWTNNQTILDYEFESWAICDQEGNILLAVNDSTINPYSQESKMIYFNLLRSRDTKVYMDSWSQTVAGDISDIDGIEPPTSSTSNRSVRFLRRIETPFEESEQNEEPINESE